MNEQLGLHEIVTDAKFSIRTPECCTEQKQHEFPGRQTIFLKRTTIGVGHILTRTPK